MPAGRPSDYSEAIAAEICSRLSEGLSLRKICLADDMPEKTTVFRWLGKHEEFRNQYAKAREAGMDAMAEDCLDIADDGTNDFGFKEGDDADGEGAKPVFLAEHVQRSRLRVDTRKWLMSKMAPKKFGDATRLEHTGADGAPIPFAVTINLVKPPDGAAGTSQG
ncbi:MAG TPA: hypothetical protein VIM71_06360 [Lacunisphaera sp.]